MTESQETKTDVSDASAEPASEGWIPLLMAGVVLSGIFFFIACGLSTWYLFTKRGELALKTLRQGYIPAVEQSLLAPDEKKEVVTQLNEFADDVERNKYEDWQAAGVMQRLVRLPVFQWGELTAVESFLCSDQQLEEIDKDNVRLQISRLRRAVELDKATAFDLADVLKPVTITDDSPVGSRMVDKLDIESAKDVIVRAKLVADRSEVPDKSFDEVKIGRLVRRQIEAGIRKGTM